MNSSRNESAEEGRQHRREFPLRENWVAVVFMLALLLLAGVTASVAGYRIKLADKDRKEQLINTYKELGGSNDILITPEQSANTSPIGSAKYTFIAAYEINVRARAYGLYRCLEAFKPGDVAPTVTALNTIGATDPAQIIANSWRAFQESPTYSATPSPSGPLANPTAARLAKKYDRYMARDVETKLFKYLVDHRAEIETR
jgi:hypothetical protein